MTSSLDNQQDKKAKLANGSGKGLYPPGADTAQMQGGISSGQLQRAQADPAALSPTDLLALQRTIGNQAVQRLIHPDPVGQEKAQAGTKPPQPIIQRKLKVGPAQDRYEDEADQVAQQVMRTPVSAKQRKDDEEKIQATSSAKRTSEEGFETDSAFQNRLSRTKGGGQPLPDKTRAELEPRFGADLGAVRVHTGAESHALNHDVQAKAFTHGNDIHFTKGAYNPGSSAGKQLLAHELTHTIQQTGGTPLQRKKSGASHRRDEIDDLQRTPAISKAAGAKIQRNVTVTTGQMSSSIGFGEGFLNIFGFAKDKHFASIKKQLDKYEKATTWQGRILPLRMMLFYAEQ